MKEAGTSNSDCTSSQLIQKQIDFREKLQRRIELSMWNAEKDNSAKQNKATEWRPCRSSSKFPCSHSQGNWEWQSGACTGSHPRPAAADCSPRRALSSLVHEPSKFFKKYLFVVVVDLVCSCHPTGKICYSMYCSFSALHFSKKMAYIDQNATLEAQIARILPDNRRVRLECST